MHLQCEYSDLTIICKGRKCDRQFEAHKIVLCQRSEYLASLCEDLEKSQVAYHPYAEGDGIERLMYELHLGPIQATV